MNRIITLPPHVAEIQCVARVLASFVAHMDAEARGRIDPAACARLMLLSQVDHGSLVTPAGDALLTVLLAEVRRVQAERRPAKGGAA